METLRVENSNPLADLISDEVYEVLAREGLIDERGLRDYQIQTLFRKYRAAKVSASAAIELIQKEYPYLGFDSINKIVYKARK